MTAPPGGDRAGLGSSMIREALARLTANFLK
jgi:hypothetical protein